MLPAPFGGGLAGTRHPGVRFGRGPSFLLTGGEEYLTTVFTGDDADSDATSNEYIRRPSLPSDDSTDFSRLHRGRFGGGMSSERRYRNVFGRGPSTLLTGRHIGLPMSRPSDGEIETTPARGGSGGSGDGNTEQSGSVLLTNWRRRPGNNNHEMEDPLPDWLRDVNVPAVQSRHEDEDD